MKKIGLVLAVLVLCTVAQAGMIQGSTGWTIFGNITSNYPTFTMPQPPTFLSGMLINLPGTGDFVAVPNWTTPTVDFTKATWLSSTPLNVASPAGWTFGSAAFGTWVTTSGTITSQNSSFLFLSLAGTFTPGTMFGGLTQNTGTMTVGFNMNGNTATNVNGTMAMNAVPEPATMLLLGLGAVLLRKKK